MTTGKFPPRRPMTKPAPRPRLYADMLLSDLKPPEPDAETRKLVEQMTLVCVRRVVQEVRKFFFEVKR